MTSTDILFKPFETRNLTLKNRVVMAPMTRNMCPDNVPGDHVVDYYRKRAEGGVGLIITEGTHPEVNAAEGYLNVPFFHGEALNGWARVVTAVHEAGGKIAPQLWHCGGMRGSGDLKIGEGESLGHTPSGMNVPGTKKIAPQLWHCGGMRGSGDLKIGEGEALGHTPSGMNVPGKKNRHTMTDSEIQDAIDAFVGGVTAAKAIGFDAVELHGAHGYLLDQFFWDGTNVREDQWGGDMALRGQFVAEIVRASRQAVGADFPIILRYSQWKQQDFTARLAESPDALESFLTPLVDAGVDLFHCSQRRFWESEFEGSDLNLAGWTKKLTGVPTITVGSISLDKDFIPEPGEGFFSGGDIASIDKLLESLEKGEFDLAAVGRALIANPDWANKVQQGGVSNLAPYEKEMLLKLA